MDGEVAPVSQWAIETPADEMRREIADLKAAVASLQAQIDVLTVSVGPRLAPLQRVVPRD